MDNPCGACADYPNWCRGICRDKAKYLAEVDEEVPVGRKMEFCGKRTKVDANKNGIRREAR